MKHTCDVFYVDFNSRVLLLKERQTYVNGQLVEIKEESPYRYFGIGDIINELLVIGEKCK